MESTGKMYNSVPLDYTEKISENPSLEKKDTTIYDEISNILALHFKEEWKNGNDPEVAASLQNFQKKLIDQVKFKTVQKMNKELLSQQENIADYISQYMLEIYKQQLVKDFNSHYNVKSNVKSHSQKEEEDVNVFIGYQPVTGTIVKETIPITNTTNSTTSLNLNIPGTSEEKTDDNIYLGGEEHNEIEQPQLKQVNKEPVKKISMTPYKTTTIKTNLIATSIAFSLVGFIILTSLLFTILTPVVFFSNISLLDCALLVFISISLCLISEIHFYEKTLAVSTSGIKSFRWFYFPCKMLFVTTILGFCLLSQFDYHPINTFYYTSPALLQWNAIFNQIVSVLQSVFSFRTMRIIQVCLLYIGLLYVCTKLLYIFIFRKNRS